MAGRCESPQCGDHQLWDVAFKKEAEPRSPQATSFCDKWLAVVSETCTLNSKSCLHRMDVASPGMGGIDAVWLCDNKEQLCALAFLCFELSVPLELTVLQRWVSPKWHFLQRAGGFNLVSNNRSPVKPARPCSIRQALVLCAMGCWRDSHVLLS